MAVTNTNKRELIMELLQKTLLNLIHQVDLSTPEKIEVFESWKATDGSKLGLAKLMGKEIIIVSFSGGKTSAYMCQWLIKEYGHLYHFVFIFANTGLEREETLDFVNQCDKEFGLDLAWVEAVTNPVHMKGVTHRITNYTDAYRMHQYKDPKHPFNAHIAKNGIPNANKPQCSDRLKEFAIEHYKKVNGLKGFKHALGMRHDEPNRVLPKPKRVLLESVGIDCNMWRLDYKEARRRTLDAYSEEFDVLVKNSTTDKEKKILIAIKSLYKHNKYNLFYPFSDWVEFDKQDVNAHWESMPFTLNLEEHEGNCTTCWKKSDTKIFLLAIVQPYLFEAFRWWEKIYKHVKPNANGQERVFFRGNRSADMMLEEANNHDEYTLRKMIGYKDDQDSGCSESCEAYQD